MGTIFRNILDALWGSIQEALSSFDMASNLKIGDAEIGLVNSFWALIQIVATGMTIIYFLMELNRAWLYEGREMTVKTFGTPFIKLAIALGVLSISKKLVSWILSGCNALIHSAEGMSDYYTKTTSESVFEDVSMWWFVVYVILLVVFILLSWIIHFVFLYKAVVFKLELLIRLCATPIALSDIYSGANSLGVRWLKGLFAMGLYGAMLVLIPKIGGVFVEDIIKQETGLLGISGIIATLGAVIVVPIAEIGAMSVARQVSKEALGA